MFACFHGGRHRLATRIGKEVGKEGSLGIITSTSGHNGEAQKLPGTSPGNAEPVDLCLASTLPEVFAFSARSMRISSLGAGKLVAVLVPRGQDISTIEDGDGTLALDDMSIRISSSHATDIAAPPGFSIVHVSPSLRQVLSLSSAPSFGYMKLISQAAANGEELLRIFLERAVSSLVSDSKPQAGHAQKYVVTGPGPLHGMQLQCEPCLWDRSLKEGTQRSHGTATREVNSGSKRTEAVPALLVRHSWFNSASISPSIALASAAAQGGEKIGVAAGNLLLEEVPALLTICTLDGKVLFQVNMGAKEPGLSCSGGVGAWRSGEASITGSQV